MDLQKLKELNELLTNGVIDQSEFITLKDKLINELIGGSFTGTEPQSPNHLQEELSSVYSNSNKQKIEEIFSEFSHTPIKVIVLENLLIITSNKRKKLLDLQGNNVGNFDCDDLSYNYSHWIERNENQYTIYDIHFNKVITLNNYNRVKLGKDFIIVRRDRDDKYGLLNYLGEEIMPMKYWNIWQLSDNLLNIEVKTFGNGTAVFNKKGEIIIPPSKKRKYTCFSEGLSLVSEGLKSGYMDESGKIVIPITYDYGMSFSDGLAQVGKRNSLGQVKIGFIDHAGKLVIPFNYDPHRNGDDLSNFYQNVCVLEKFNLFGAIDKQGNIIIPFTYSELIYLGCGLFAFKKNKEFGVCSDNKIILNDDFHRVDFENGLLKVEKEEKDSCGVYDLNGKLILPNEYTNISILSNNLIIGVKDNRLYKISLNIPI
jgi:hypothetical protein